MTRSDFAELLQSEALVDDSGSISKRVAIVAINMAIARTASRGQSDALTRTAVGLMAHGVEHGEVDAAMRLLIESLRWAEQAIDGGRA